MSDKQNINYNTISIMPWFLIFVIVKACGHTFAAWSWWWILSPIVPPIYEVVKRWGL